MDKVGQFVDDRETLDGDTFGLSLFLSDDIHTHTEGKDQRPRFLACGGCRRKQDIAFGNRADPGMDDNNPDFIVLELLQRVLDRFHRPVYISLYNNLQFFQVRRGKFIHSLLNLYLLNILVVFHFLHIPALQGDILGDFIVFDNEELIARARNFVKSHDLHGLRRKTDFDFLSLIVEHGAYFTHSGTHYETVAHRDFSGADHDSRDSALTDIHFRFDNETYAALFGIAFEFHDFGAEDDRFEQGIDTGLLYSRYVDELDFTAPFLGQKPLFGELLLEAFGIGVRQVHLVDRDNDRHLGGLRVVQRFDSLGHHALGGRNDKDHDVGDFRSARAHRRKGFVAGSVEENDPSAVCLNLIGSDMLGDSAALVLDDVRIPDRVEKARLTVVDMAHYRNNRRTGLEVFLVVRLLFYRNLFFETFDLDFAIEFRCEDNRGIRVDIVVNGGGNAQFHQFLDQDAGLDLHLLGHIGNLGDLSDLDLFGDHDLALFLLQEHGILHLGEDNLFLPLFKFFLRQGSVFFPDSRRPTVTVAVGLVFTRGGCSRGRG